MACYNTFVVMDCKTRKSILTTSSARKSYSELMTGKRIDVWNNNAKVDSIYERTKEKMKPYILEEKDYIRRKQAAAQERNARKWQKKVW